MDVASVRFSEKKYAVLYQDDISTNMNQENSTMNFHSHLSDGILQNAATVNYYMEVI